MLFVEGKHTERLTLYYVCISGDSMTPVKHFPKNKSICLDYYFEYAFQNKD